ncbi:MAG TPA: DUF882 domain-containing protein [Afifellaceae bacterium]|nr:DUF882 domain-containing protein [Afifellaceae bacterium]
MAWGRVLSLRLRATAVACALLAGLAAALTSAAEARETRTLKLHFTHTGERGTFTYRRGGQYDRKELDRINHILRDWRRNEPTRMDPALLDLLWEVHRRTGSNEYIHVISAYRSPTTNEALRKRSSGVAQNSQHTRGRAMDFFIPGVPLDRLRAIALTAQGGGVGYYPGSGSPFVHVDTGSVRHWPRMTRQQLVSVFPNGETLHVPSDGKPLPGYERAVAKRKSGESIAVASAASGGDQASMSGWLQRVFSRGDGERPTARERPAAATQPTAVARAEPRPVEPPRAVPAPRPGEVDETIVAEVETDEVDTASAPMPRAAPVKVRALLMAARDRARLFQMASAATEPSSPQPRPAVEPAAVAALGPRRGEAAADAVSADAALAGLYAAASGGNPEAGAARLMPAAAVRLEQAYAPADSGAGQPLGGEVAVALLSGTGVAGVALPATAGSARGAVEMLRGRADESGETDAGEPSAAFADESADSTVEQTSEVAERGAEPPPAQSAVAVAGSVGLVPVRLDLPLLQRLMSHETTRTGAFGALARPQPRPDLYLVPAHGDATMALAQLGQPRTDRFQRR